MSSAPVSLFHRLFDDASGLPPVAAPVEVAVAEFRARSRGPYAELIGPLLIGAAAVGDLLDVLRAGPGDALPVVVVAGPGSDPLVLADAVDRLTHELPDHAHLVGVEVVHSPRWRDALTWGVPLAVEIGPAAEQLLVQIGDVAEAARSHPVRAKLATGSTPGIPLPRPEVLAGFLLGCARRRLPFTLTGGLHHAAPTEMSLPGGGTERQHGLLNVLLATELAVAHARGNATGSDAEAATPLERVATTLTERDAGYLAQRIGELGEEQASGLREHFTSYGGGSVLLPIDELTTLELLPAASSSTAPAERPATPW
ncbi:hypothetical protein [Ornithinimicrobium murale]|uniref:hypothetical protein n=1 Tax=Ornithinimicrobium murale TaxID=1050153 RepID=UPI0013B401CC|nr:hypothetical protein [Ornithinimicrobium murale]